MSQSEKTVLIVTAIVNPSEKEALVHYQQNAGKLLVQAGGKPVGKFKITEHLAGSNTPHIAVLMEFDSSDSIKSVFNSEAYKALIPYREKAFSDINISIGIQQQ